jgi:hypothetical protein
LSFMFFYTIGAIASYFLASSILNRIEIKRGKRFEHRSLIFFVLIFGLALGYMFLVNPEPPMPLPGTEAPASNGGTL